MARLEAVGTRRRGRVSECVVCGCFLDAGRAGWIALLFLLGPTVYLHRRAAKTIDVMQLADRVEAVEESQKKVGPVVDDRLADVRKALAETVDASTKTFLDKTARETVVETARGVPAPLYLFALLAPACG